MWGNVVLHMVLEAIGGAIAWYAYGFCSHWRHRLAVWLVLSFVFSLLTVGMVG